MNRPSQNSKGAFGIIFLFITAAFIVGFYNLSMSWLFVFLPIILIYGILSERYISKKKKQCQDYIINYQFPALVTQRFLQDHPMTDEQLKQVELGLKQFFLIAHFRRGKIAMPSKIVDEYWHHFLLNTPHYQEFCHHAFGETLHHIPDEREPLPPSTIDKFSPPMRNTYLGAKQVAAEFPLMMIAGMPLIFALDSTLNISDGFYYDNEIMERLEQQTLSAEAGSTGDIGSNSDGNSCGGTTAEGCGDSGGGADGGGCSSSCSGGGCGGGCGGS